MRKGGIVALLLVACLLPVVPAANITVSIQPGDLILREREPFTLSCTATVEGGTANISLYYSWEKDGELILNGTNEISVVHASTSDSGVYVCIVQADGICGTSENVTISVIASGSDNGPLIAIIVCVTAVGIILIIFFTSIGLYMCLCMSRERCSGLKLCCCESQVAGKQRKPQKVPAKLSPSVPRRFTRKDRAKSKSLSQLLQANYPLASNLGRSSSNLLTASQPTQVTEVEDPHTLNDLGLDESMFERSLPGTPSNGECRSQNKRRVLNKMGGRNESKRRASEGMLVVPTTVARSTSLKSILKESRSVNENLNERSKSSAVSDVSSEMTHSDDNSLHLRKSVRFNVEEWAEDSGVQTGTSTPHYIPYPSLKRRASEPDAFGYHYSNGKRRGSAPGDLVSQTALSESREEGEDVDEGMATGSEQWNQQENDFDFEKGRVEKRFEGIFSSDQQATDPETESKTQVQKVDVAMSDNIASRVAQLYSAAQKQSHSSGKFTRGPSCLTTSSYSSATISVAEVKKRLLERKQMMTGNTEREDVRRPSVSKFVQERVEVFRQPTERLRTASLDRAQLRRGKPLDIGMYAALGEGLGPMKGKSLTERAVVPAKEMLQPEQMRKNRVAPGSPLPKPGKKMESSIAPGSPIPKLGKNKEKKTKAAPRSPLSSAPPAPVAIPVFSGHSSLSNWVPACLRETVVSPYSYKDDDETMNKGEEEESDSLEDLDMNMMEPLQPTLGTPSTSTGTTTTNMAALPTFGGVATVTPIGRSWLSSPSRVFGGSQPIKPIMPGVRDMSEQMHIQQGGHILGAIKRLSVIPEETASACSSMTSMHPEQ